MLANYASFLSLDPEPLLLRFAEGLQSQLSARRPDATSREVLPSQAPTRRRRQLFNRDLLIGGLLAILLLAFGIWGGLRIAEMRSATQSPPTAPSLAEVLVPSPTPSPAPSPTATQASLLDEPARSPDIPLEPTAAPDPVQVIPSGATGSVQVQIVVEERTYMRALVDDEQVFNGRVLPGSAYLFVADVRVEIVTGSASALRVTFNQQELGTLGNFGQALTRVFTLEGLQTPTPTITPTAGEVPESELTPQP
jgi:cytoskeletal protein RodZ